MVIFILKSIYKITNLLNGKIYIGQSINPENRWKQHQYSDSIIGNAIRKYGIENFSFEIIEDNIENYNEREIFWINFYNSDNKKFGYNLTSGGENPPILRGENSSISKYTDAFVESIKQDLLNTNMNFQEIMNKYQISDVYLSMLNRGKFRKDPNYSYPIRKHGNETTPIDVVMKIIHELQYTTKTTREIAKENNIGEVVVWEINTGRKQNLPNDIEYPIRYPYHTISKKIS